MTSTHDTWRERIASARATLSIITMLEGRAAAQVVWATVLDTAVAVVPAANRRADRRFKSFEMVFDTTKSPLQSSQPAIKAPPSVRTVIIKNFDRSHRQRPDDGTPTDPSAVEASRCLFLARFALCRVRRQSGDRNRAQTRN